MSMPGFPDSTRIPSTDEAINLIISSIALEEIALSHVLEAESEKIKFIVECAKAKGCENLDIDELLTVNNSVAEVIKSIVILQKTLKEKLDIATDKIIPIPPCPPPCPPPCLPVFITQIGYLWGEGESLFLLDKNHCGGGIHLCRKKGETFINLPGSGSYDILFELSAMNKSPVKIDVEFFVDGKINKIEHIVYNEDKKYVEISRLMRYSTPVGSEDNRVLFRLVSPGLSRVAGTVTVSAAGI